MQYEAVELLLCLSILLVLSQHRHLYKDLLPHLHKSVYVLEAGSILWQNDTDTSKLRSELMNNVTVGVGHTASVCTFLSNFSVRAESCCPQRKAFGAIFLFFCFSCKI